nr:DUF3300 domain-containing protein [Erwinia endophytica]
MAQVLAASLHPDDVASACVWLLQNKTLSGAALRQSVDARDWPPAVKALTGFPDVLAQMARNLSWTRSLGDAYRDATRHLIISGDGVYSSAIRRRSPATGP